MKAKIEQTHREAAEAALGEPEVLFQGEYDEAADRVAQALADAEQRGAESLAASQQRQGGADGREVNIIVYQYGPSPSGPWGEARHDCLTSLSPDDWQVQQTRLEPERAYKRSRVVTYVPAESRQQQWSGWFRCSEHMPEKRTVVLFRALGTETCCGTTNGKVWLDLTDMYADGPQEYDAADVTHWMPLPPPPPERPAKEPSDD